MRAGQAFARLGHHVTLVEAEDRLLPALDDDAGVTVEERLTGDGVEVRTETSVVGASSSEEGMILELEDGAVLRASAVIGAVGRRTVTDGLGLTASGCRPTRPGP